MWVVDFVCRLFVVDSFFVDSFFSCAFVGVSILFAVGVKHRRPRSGIYLFIEHATSEGLKDAVSLDCSTTIFAGVTGT